MTTSKSSVLCVLLTINCLQLIADSTSVQPDKHANDRSLTLLHRLLATQANIPVDRRKAVTIGFNRWRRPLTFKVPDVISNLIPSSSNIIKVHDEPNNNKSVAAEEAKPTTYGIDQKSPLTNYDPLQLINFEQNSFFAAAKPDGSQVDPGSAAFPNSSTFAIDESQLASLFNMQQTQVPQNQLQQPLQLKHQFEASQQLGDPKPYSMSEQGENNFAHLSDEAMIKKPAYYHSPSVDHFDMHHHHPHHQSSQMYHPDQAVPYRKKNFYQLTNENQRPTMNQHEYFSSNQHLAPHRNKGSANYDFNRVFNEPNRENFLNMVHQKGESMLYHNQDHQKSQSQPYRTYSAEYPESKESDEFDQANSDQSFYSSQGTKSRLTTEPPFNYRDFSGMMESANTGNESTRPFADDFFAHHGNPPSEEPTENGEGGGLNDDKTFNHYEAHKAKLEHSEPTGYNNYFSNGFHSAASVIHPVVVKSEALTSATDSNERFTVEKVPALSGSSNGLNNAFPYPPSKTNLPRPVANRIKEFFKSMLAPKY